MATRPFLRRALRLAGIAFAATMLAAGPALLPAVPLQASTSAAPPSPVAVDQGIIAYVNRVTTDIHLISPDGTGDHVLWTAPQSSYKAPAYDLAWRPDGRELAFSSDHELACSWYESDVYAIGYNGAGYRRVTNAPACAELASLPKGSVTVEVTNYMDSTAMVYVAGAPHPLFASDGTMTFNDVADFGPGVYQPSIGIYGVERFRSYPPLADVLPNQTVAGGSVTIWVNGAIEYFGVGDISWNADGSALAYAMRTSSGISQIPAVPPYGSIGVQLPVIANASPYLVAWGPTAATQDEYLYATGMDVLHANVGGIYLNRVGDASGGTQLVRVDDYSGDHVYDIQWLPDASGFLVTYQWVDINLCPHVTSSLCSEIWEFDFATNQANRLTSFGDGSVGQLSISPDGQYVVFERIADPPFNSASSLWIMNRDGAGLHKLADDAGRPAWGRAPAPLKPSAYLPLLVR